MKINYDPEFASVESFVEYLTDDERETFTVEELMELSASVRKTSRVLRADLESYGLRLEPRKEFGRVRGFSMTSND